MPKKSASVWSFFPLWTITRGPPPWSGVITRSANPSRSKSAAATNNPPVKLASKALNRRSSAPVLPSMTTTVGVPPGPAAAMMSG